MMTREEFKEKLAAAGATKDGHVTNGSLEAQMTLVDQRVGEAFDEAIRIMRVAISSVKQL